MAKRKASAVRYEPRSYEVGYSTTRHTGYVVFPRDQFSVAAIKDGFWVDDDLQPARVGQERYYIMPHMISYVRKDYRKAGSK